MRTLMMVGLRIVGVAGVLVVSAGCERVGEALDRARPAQPTAPTPVQLDSAGPAVPSVARGTEPAVLSSLAGWDAASSPEKEAAARYVDKQLPWMTFVGLETFSCGGQTHEIALFEHTKAGLGFSLLPAGTFEMGSKSSESGRSADEERHRVTLTRPFLICRTEVTQDGWNAIRSKNPSQFPGGQNPVETVTMIDVGRFLSRAKLSLPSEAQWEYACRAGTNKAYNYGGEPSGLGDYAWFESNSAGTTHPVARKKPNAFGLYDMHGNVLEWCRDGYHAGDGMAATDPVGAKASDVVVRGGSWQNLPTVHRAAFRLRTHPGDKHGGIGFRPIKELRAP